MTEENSTSEIEGSQDLEHQKDGTMHELVEVGRSQTALGNKRERITLDVSPEVAAEVERLCANLGIKKIELFRQALGVLRLVVDETAKGNRICIVNPANPGLMRQIEIIPLTSPR